MKSCGEVGVKLIAFVTSFLHGGELSASRCGRLTYWERILVIHWIGVWVDPRVGLDSVVKAKAPAPARNLTPVVQPVSVHIQ
jgi:hypothetical protein